MARPLVPDALWAKIQPLLPPPRPRPKGGRPPVADRAALIRSPRTDGFVERFNGTVLEEFFRPAMHARLYEGVETLQAELDAWLTPLQPRATAPGLPQPGQATVGDGRTICQTRRLRGHLVR